ncbi:MAG: energy-coupling factor ABC transporter ATP-binding protein [Thaumarchaeota archaeon]|nr:energy-coupling factor ABC transporter ATP-binding protein [Nitrososphaerota archaeon]
MQLNSNLKDGKPIVSFEDVFYSHPNGNVALKGVNFSLRQSEVLAILGSNGAGKTTLVRHINGLLKPTRGKVSVFGEDTKQLSSAQLSRRVGIVFQNPNNQLFAQSVRKEIEFGLRNFGFSEDILKKRVESALNDFSLLDYADRPPMELSGGEKKRLCIALVLAWDPDILILDEPTVGQDSEQKEKLSEMTRLLQSQNKNVILVTHDVEFVWPLQPRIILMANGLIVADGTSQAVLSDSDFTNRADVLAPQLVDFSKLMGFLKPFPSAPFEAEKILRIEHG